MAKQFWREYYARQKDPFGHKWILARMLQHFSYEEAGHVANEAFNSK